MKSNIKLVFICIFLIASNFLLGQDCMRKMDISTETTEMQFKSICNFWLYLIESNKTDELLTYFVPNKKISKRYKRKIKKVIKNLANKNSTESKGSAGYLHVEFEQEFYERIYFGCDLEQKDVQMKVILIGKKINNEYYIDELYVSANEKAKDHDNIFDFLIAAKKGGPPPFPPPFPYLGRDN